MFNRERQKKRVLFSLSTDSLSEVILMISVRRKEKSPDRMDFFCMQRNYKLVGSFSAEHLVQDLELA